MLKLNISSVHTSIEEDLNKYVVKKIGKLDKYIPRTARSSAHATIYLKESRIKNKKQCTCEVVMHLPREEFAVKETTLNIFAAVDIVEAKLKNQLRKYKEKRLASSRIFRIIKRPKRKK